MASTRVDLEVVRPADVEAQPWANGLGVTRVLVDRGHGRLSVAEIEGTTPFSPLPGLDRMLVPLTAPGLGLVIDGRRMRVRAGESVEFRGEDAVVGEAGMRRVSVVNVMTRRGAASLDARIVCGSQVDTRGADALVVLDGRVSTPADRLLPAGAALLPGAVPTVVSAEHGAVLVVRWGRLP
ncbi:HutD family protein [Microbacterium sp. NPDC089696]|uniref:HutD family protein n=1 Tax=Microbacterium sp. NPDC089696 TaxID=3364199 RepID=UPI00381CD3B0